MQVDDFQGRVAFVTGGAQGIGLGIARALAKQGVKVAVVDISKDALAVAHAELAPLTDVVTAVLDVRDRDAYAAVADDVEGQLGPVTLLFNNAGIIGATSPRRMSYESWDWVIGINLGGVYNGVQTFIPRMIERGDGGYMVNTASGAGLVALGSGYLYATSKFAIVGLSESLHLELMKHDIGVSVLCPGPVATNIIRNTQETRPESDPSTSTVNATLAEAERRLAAGTSPDAVGEMVIDAMRAGRLFIHTDDTMGEYIKLRTGMVLDALPSALAQ
jgi:NAD(P)-dependent dehydrogenase (short-subunit alcohol dehydrogenase family)